MSDTDKTIPPPEDPQQNPAVKGDSSDTPGDLHPSHEKSSFNHQGNGESELPGEFGRYEVKKLLGKGAMGSVYLAYDTQLDRKVALKVPKVRFQKGSKEYQRFYREAQSAGTLRHASICPVYDVGEIEGIHYICMAYIEGRPLADYINSGRKISQQKAATVIEKMADALEVAHRQGIIHRDLKPENVIIDRSGEPIITDFGLAHRLQNRNARLTQDGALLGSPGFMSPEQIEGDVEQMDNRSDIYSLGVLFFELLTGRLPFEGTTAAVLGQIIAKEPPSVSEFRPDINPDLEAICMKMMKKSPGDRFQTMKETSDSVSEALKNFSSVQKQNDKPDTETDNSTITPPEIQQAISPDKLAEIETENQPVEKSVRMSQLPSWLITIGIILGLLITGLGVAVVSLYVRMDSNNVPENQVPPTIQSSMADSKYTFLVDEKPIASLDEMPALKNGSHVIELKDDQGVTVHKKEFTMDTSHPDGEVPAISLGFENGKLILLVGADYSKSKRGMIEKVLAAGGKVKLETKNEGVVTINSREELPSTQFDIIHFDFTEAAQAEPGFLEELQKKFPDVEILTEESDE